MKKTFKSSLLAICILLHSLAYAGHGTIWTEDGETLEVTSPTSSSSFIDRAWDASRGFLSQSNVSARSAVVIDNTTGEVLVDKQSTQVVPMASLTKLMTAMVVLDQRPDMAERITLVDSDFKGAREAGSKLHVGDTLNRAELMLIMLMKSENPAAKALARTSSYGFDGFVKAMNKKAKAIGMRSAYFEDSSGLNGNNHATAYDIARMTTAASEYGAIREFSTQKKYDFYINDRVLTAQNTNAIVREGNWDIGLSKTGYISEAGRCVVMRANINQRPTTIVLLGAKTSGSRTNDAKNILGWLQAKYTH